MSWEFVNLGNFQMGDHNQIYDNKGSQDEFYWKIINDTLEKQGNQEHLKSEFLKEMEDCTKKKEKRKLKQVMEKWGLPVFTGFLSNILSNETIWFGLLKWLKQ